ncbi:hypothetical protein HF086_016818 [Spodoptera exigua]|uniref:Uncharacterized protein n=1 Tax=Spodoptera exigua TaxID=7107 RepID=A0A922SIQ3_SPOEX|nr:hypothetical protein HF086_016818 [Spodoptera exigua]
MVSFLDLFNFNEGTGFRLTHYNTSLPIVLNVQDLFHNSPIVHPDYWKDKPTKRLNEAVKEVLPNLGYHGKNKYKYAFHEPWKPLDRVSLLEEAEKQELENAEDTTIKTDKQGL